MLSEWIASISSYFPTSAESYVICCILSRETGMMYFVVAVIRTHTCFRSLTLQVMLMYLND